jgi:hypothetical protein
MGQRVLACADPERVAVKRSGVIRRTRVKRTNTADQAEKRAREFDRKYGSEARVLWIIAQRSVVSGERPCVNAHVKGGGMGRKADFRWIVPLTAREHDELHRVGKPAFQDKYAIDLGETARRIAAEWLRAEQDHTF